MTDSNESLDNAELEDVVLIQKSKDVPKFIEWKLASVLLNLENCFHVPVSAIDELLNELHYLVNPALVPVAKNILAT